MNRKQLLDLGIPKQLHQLVFDVMVAREPENRKLVVGEVQSLSLNPTAYLSHQEWGQLAMELMADRNFLKPEPAPYQVWGRENIQGEAVEQLEKCCQMPDAVGAALMPDAHLGYGLPIGGVLALDNAICPYAVGVDIACSVKVSLLDLPCPTKKLWQDDILVHALQEGTKFGLGAQHDKAPYHEVLDHDWSITAITKEMKDKAWQQLGSSGGGNHFVEFGLIELEDNNVFDVPAGSYMALMSHSGSRGAGYNVCNHYSELAQANVPHQYADLEQAKLGWLSLDSEAGQEYWLAMNLMGEYAKANHEVIHRLVSTLCGAQIVGGVYNHHNFAWKENHFGRDLYVHRKGATPAWAGQLGIIPSSMADPSYIVRGLGKPESYMSSSHGAGRALSRSQAKKKYSFRAVQQDLARKGVNVLLAGADEVPYAYKDIEYVMDAQSDLVEIVAAFIPKVVMMAGEEKDRRKLKNKDADF